MAARAAPAARVGPPDASTHVTTERYAQAIDFSLDLTASRPRQISGAVVDQWKSALNLADPDSSAEHEAEEIVKVTIGLDLLVGANNPFGVRFAESQLGMQMRLIGVAPMGQVARLVKLVTAADLDSAVANKIASRLLADHGATDKEINSDRDVPSRVFVIGERETSFEAAVRYKNERMATPAVAPADFLRYVLTQTHDRDTIKACLGIVYGRGWMTLRAGEMPALNAIMREVIDGFVDMSAVEAESSNTFVHWARVLCPTVVQQTSQHIYTNYAGPAAQGANVQQNIGAKVGARTRGASTEDRGTQEARPAGPSSDELKTLWINYMPVLHALSMATCRTVALVNATDISAMDEATVPDYIRRAAGETIELAIERTFATQGGRDTDTSVPMETSATRAAPNVAGEVLWSNAIASVSRARGRPVAVSSASAAAAEDGAEVMQSGGRLKVVKRKRATHDRRERNDGRRPYTESDTDDEIASDADDMSTGDSREDTFTMGAPMRPHGSVLQGARAATSAIERHVPTGMNVNQVNLNAEVFNLHFHIHGQPPQPPPDQNPRGNRAGGPARRRPADDVVALDAVDAVYIMPDGAQAVNQNADVDAGIAAPPPPVANADDDAVLRRIDRAAMPAVQAEMEQFIEALAIVCGDSTEIWAMDVWNAIAISNDEARNGPSKSMAAWLASAETLNKTVYQYLGYGGELLSFVGPATLAYTLASSIATSATSAVASGGAVVAAAVTGLLMWRYGLTRTMRAIRKTWDCMGNVLPWLSGSGSGSFQTSRDPPTAISNENAQAFLDAVSVEAATDAAVYLSTCIPSGRYDEAVRNVPQLTLVSALRTAASGASLYQSMKLYSYMWKSASAVGSATVAGIHATSWDDFLIKGHMTTLLLLQGADRKKAFLHLFISWTFARLHTNYIATTDVLGGTLKMLYGSEQKAAAIASTVGHVYASMQLVGDDEFWNEVAMPEFYSAVYNEVEKAVIRARASEPPPPANDQYVAHARVVLEKFMTKAGRMPSDGEMDAWRTLINDRQRSRLRVLMDTICGIALVPASIDSHARVLSSLAGMFDAPVAFSAGTPGALASASRTIRDAAAFGAMYVLPQTRELARQFAIVRTQIEVASGVYDLGTTLDQALSPKKQWELLASFVRPAGLRAPDPNIGMPRLSGLFYRATAYFRTKVASASSITKDRTFAMQLRTREMIGVAAMWYNTLVGTDGTWETHVLEIAKGLTAHTRSLHSLSEKEIQDLVLQIALRATSHKFWSIDGQPAVHEAVRQLRTANSPLAKATRQLLRRTISASLDAPIALDAVPGNDTINRLMYAYCVSVVRKCWLLAIVAPGKMLPSVAMAHQARALPDASSVPVHWTGLPRSQVPRARANADMTMSMPSGGFASAMQPCANSAIEFRQAGTGGFVLAVDVYYLYLDGLGNDVLRYVTYAVPHADRARTLRFTVLSKTGELLGLNEDKRNRKKVSAADQKAAETAYESGKSELRTAAHKAAAGDIMLKSILAAVADHGDEARELCDRIARRLSAYRTNGWTMTDEQYDRWTPDFNVLRERYVSVDQTTRATEIDALCMHVAIDKKSDVYVCNNVAVSPAQFVRYARGSGAKKAGIQVENVTRNAVDNNCVVIVQDGQMIGTRVPVQLHDKVQAKYKSLLSSSKGVAVTARRNAFAAVYAVHYAILARAAGVDFAPNGNSIVHLTNADADEGEQGPNYRREVEQYALQKFKDLCQAVATGRSEESKRLLLSSLQLATKDILGFPGIGSVTDIINVFDLYSANTGRCTVPEACLLSLLKGDEDATVVIVEENMPASGTPASPIARMWHRTAAGAITCHLMPATKIAFPNNTVYISRNQESYSALLKRV